MQEAVKPYHSLLLRGTFRAGLRALPSRKEMLSVMAMVPPPECDPCWPGWEESAAAGAGLTPEERVRRALANPRPGLHVPYLEGGKVQSHVREVLSEEWD